VRMVPSRGDHLFDALLRPLHAYAERAGMDAYELVKHLVKQPKNLSRRMQDIVAKGLNTDGLVLFLDQMEELFTVRDLAQSQAFLSALYQAAQEARLHVIATIRSDFLQYCHEQAELRSVLNGQGHYALGSIDGMSIREMITKPAYCAGLSLSEKLVRRLTREAGDKPGGLPLLAFALQQLFDKRVGKELTEKVYDELGGLAGAIGEHVKTVEETVAQSFAIEYKEMFSKIFAPLVVVTIDGQPTRKRTAKESFGEDLRPVIEVLIKERLLNVEGEGHESVVSVAHETLFGAWPTLARWVAENREDLFVLSQAEIEAGEWQRHRYDLKYLWHEDRLKKLTGIIERFGNKQVNDAVRLYAAPQDKLIERLHHNALSHTERVKIGQYLAAFGDPRPGVGLKEDGLPDIDWIKIPGGQVKLGFNQVLEVKPFHMAKYLVTNAQFEAFRKAEDGYRNEEWLRDMENSETVAEPRWGEANAPRETVSWFEAVAFCRWLSAKTGTSIRLPTEWEWQQAATGGDPTNEYPWPGEWDTSRCNSKESRLSRTTAVGMYPHGATKQGVMDMAGNVWEWCLKTYEQPEAPEPLPIDESNTSRVLRGGSWDNKPENLRVSARGRYYADTQTNSIGFRLAQSARTASGRSLSRPVHGQAGRGSGCP
jgi:hypothetical protein